MTDKERLDALTMNLELTARETADLRESTSDLRASVADLRASMATLGERVDSLVVGTANLLRVSESHERRLTRIEGGPA